MKKSILIPLYILMIGISCQKELDFIAPGISEGTLKIDVNGDCLPATVNGIYQTDTLLNNTNFIDVQVTVTVTGTYDIRSDTVNGFSFKGAGNLDAGGINTVRLFGSGKPITTGLNSFLVKYGTSICTIDITVIGTGTNASVFTLSGAPGTCSGFTVNGTYTQGVSLSASNSVTFTVDVTSPGTYAIGAASVNGIGFASTGIFAATGVQTVTLNGVGIPENAGDFNIVATNLSSTCTFSLTVLPSSGGIAAFTLAGAPGVCSGALQSGNYSAGISLTTANSITLNVDVTTLGTYSISTNNVNGYSFSKSGSFTSLGNQLVILTASGIPTLAGINNFTATAGISTCTFSVTVTTPPPLNLDYIPETSFSNWSYFIVGGASTDTFYIRVNPNAFMNYRIYEDLDNGTPIDTVLHRKNGGMYYQLYNQDYGFDNKFNVEGLLLDSNLATNATWTISLGSNTVLGQPATGKISAQILQKGAAATIAGNSYTNIIKVRYTYIYNDGTSDLSYAQEEIWYAKGKGIIHYEFRDLLVMYSVIYEASRIQIF